MSEQLVLRLLEDAIWINNPTCDALEKQECNTSANHSYLHDKVFPTLIPALHALLALVQAEVEKGNTDFLQRTNAKKPLGVIVRDAMHSDQAINDYGPTLEVNPIEWVAQYLMWHSLQRSPQLGKHPYVVLHHLKKKKEENEGKIQK